MRSCRRDGFWHTRMGSVDDPAAKAKYSIALILVGLNGLSSKLSVRIHDVNPLGICFEIIQIVSQ